MRSMTGYGKSRNSNDFLEVSVEIRSVNSRYLDVSIRIPNSFAALEMPVRETLREAVVRGKISVFIDIKKTLSNSADISVDNDKFKERKQLLQSIIDSLHLNDDIKLSHLLTFSDLFELDPQALNMEEVKSLITRTLLEALHSFNSMRDSEGQFIKEDLIKRIVNIERWLGEIEDKSRQNVQMEFDRLLKNVLRLVGENKIDNTRLEQEIAIIADRVDITEECVRMRSHIQLFNETLNLKGEVGKKFNFILQEMLRETNTMNSKTSHIEIAHVLIKVKEEIEKLREQVQNLE